MDISQHLIWQSLTEEDLCFISIFIIYFPLYRSSMASTWNSVFSQVLFCFIFRILIKHDTCLAAIFLIFNHVRNMSSWRFCCATCLEYWSSMASAWKQYSYYLEILLMHSLGGKVWLHGTIRNVKVSFFGSPWFKNYLWFCDTMFDEFFYIFQEFYVNYMFISYLF